ncbi:MAG TPA: LacI family transcriptional regulator [Lachnospiraceae bacterium]|nr:LacI family transcriptional regulator [Lachnospiraceae bacterium]
MATIKDIARECQVSIATVSNVINGRNKAGAETEKRVREAIEKLGYTPNSVAKGLRSKKTNTVGIIVEDLSQFTVPPIVESIMRFLEERHYQTVVHNLRLCSRYSDTWSGNEEMLIPVIDRAISDLKGRMVDGIIYVAVYSRNTELINADPGVPLIMTCASDKNPYVPSVIIDDEGSVESALVYLIEKGHRNIGIIGGYPDNLHTVRRLNGAKKALEKAGITPSERLIRLNCLSKEDGCRAAYELSMEKITALFCMSDIIAAGVYKCLYEKGLTVGRDISVMGYDNHVIADCLTPGLTTMALPLNEIGSCAAALLLNCSSYSKPYLEGYQTRLPCELIERGSVALL